MRSYNRARKCPFKDVGQSTELSDKEDSSAQAVALQVAYWPAGLLWLIGYFGKCRICGFRVQAKLDQLPTKDLPRLDSPRIHTQASLRFSQILFMMMAQQTIMMRASQNRKKLLFGPSMPQPTPRRIASTITRAPRRIKIDTVMRSAARMLFFYQSFFHHQLAV